MDLQISVTTNVSITPVKSFGFRQNGSVSKLMTFTSSFDKQLFPPAKTGTSRIKLSYHGEESNFSKKNFQQKISACSFVSVFKKLISAFQDDGLL